MPKDEQEVLKHIRALKAHGHGEMVTKVAAHKILMINENRQHKL